MRSQNARKSPKTRPDTPENRRNFYVSKMLKIDVEKRSQNAGNAPKTCRDTLEMRPHKFFHMNVKNCRRNSEPKRQKCAENTSKNGAFAVYCFGPGLE